MSDQGITRGSTGNVQVFGGKEKQPFYSIDIHRPDHIEGRPLCRPTWFQPFPSERCCPREAVLLSWPAVAWPVTKKPTHRAASKPRVWPWDRLRAPQQRWWHNRELILRIFRSRESMICCANTEPSSRETKQCSEKKRESDPGSTWPLVQPATGQGRVQDIGVIRIRLCRPCGFGWIDRESADDWSREKESRWHER